MTLQEAIKVVKSANVNSLDDKTKDAVNAALDVLNITSDLEELKAAGFDNDLLKLAEKLSSKKKKSTAKAKTAAKASSKVKKAKASRKANAKPRAKAKQEETKAKKPKVAKANTKTKTVNPKAVTTEKPVSKTHIETAEHRQIKRYLSIRKKETLQLAMTAYKSLLKDITERKIRKTSEQASLINAIQQSYFKYISRNTSSLVLSETALKNANEFVGSQKPYETVVLVKRFIGWTGKSATEKQIKDYLKEAEKIVKDSSDNDPYLDELKSVIKALKAAKVGDTIIADNVGLSGLNSNTIKVRK